MLDVARVNARTVAMLQERDAVPASRHFGFDLVRGLVTPHIKRRMGTRGIQKFILQSQALYLGKVPVPILFFFGGGGALSLESVMSHGWHFPSCYLPQWCEFGSISEFILSSGSESLFRMWIRIQTPEKRWKKSDAGSGTGSASASIRMTGRIVIHMAMQGQILVEKTRQIYMYSIYQFC